MCTAWPYILCNIYQFLLLTSRKLSVLARSSTTLVYAISCLQIENPLAEATKYLKLLQNNSSDSLETHILSFELSMRKQKVLLAFQVCYFCLISLILPQATLPLLALITISPLCLHPDMLCHMYLCKFIDASYTAAIFSYTFFFLI